MTNKYIIKNCPCFNEGHYNLRLGGECLDLTQDENEYCVGYTNCLLKRIIEKCKEQKEPQIRDYKIDIEYFRYSARHSLAKEILSMLEIEECEE